MSWRGLRLRHLVLRGSRPPPVVRHQALPLSPRQGVCRGMSSRGQGDDFAGPPLPHSPPPPPGPPLRGDGPTNRIRISRRGLEGSFSGMLALSHAKTLYRNVYRDLLRGCSAHYSRLVLQVCMREEMAVLREREQCWARILLHRVSSAIVSRRTAHWSANRLGYVAELRQSGWQGFDCLESRRAHT